MTLRHAQRGPLPSDDYALALAELGASIVHTPLSKVMSPCKEKKPAEVRAAVYDVLRARGWTLRSIGDAFDRDHSTVHHQVEYSHRLARANPDHAYLVSELGKAAELSAPQHHANALDSASRVRERIGQLDAAIESARALRQELLGTLRHAAKGLRP